MNKINYKRNRKLVRGLDYYNGTCFEIKQLSTELESQVLGQAQNTLLAGGRYDYLASYLSGDDNKRRERLPAIGWAAGVDRLALLLEALDNQKQTTDSSDT